MTDRLLRGTYVARRSEFLRARRQPGGWWEVDCWPRFFDRDQAITALTVTELLESGHGSVMIRSWWRCARSLR